MHIWAWNQYKTKENECHSTGTSYKDLLYTKKRFITKEYLRAAINKIINATFQMREKHIWGECSTSYASDSKKFEA